MFFIVLAFLVLILLYFFGTTLRHKWFAYVMYKFSCSKDAQYEKLKKDLFKPIHAAISHDPKLRKQNALRILEVGVGTGVNFEYYPDVTNLVVIDPNPEFSFYYNENRKKFKNIKSEEIIVCGGEEMDVVDSNSVDVVVITHVMCSVKDIRAIVRQVYRVLAPGGKFYFFEHILEFSDDHRMRRLVQKACTYTGLWPLFFDGCYLTRDPLDEIKAALFSNVKAKRVHIPIKNWIFSINSPHEIGVATK